MMKNKIELTAKNSDVWFLNYLEVPLSWSYDNTHHSYWERNHQSWLYLPSLRGHILLTHLPVWNLDKYTYLSPVFVWVFLAWTPHNTHFVYWLRFFLFSQHDKLTGWHPNKSGNLSDLARTNVGCNYQLIRKTRELKQTGYNLLIGLT